MEALLGSVFEFLFKYRPVVFERGQLVFTTGWAVYAALALGLLVAAPAIVSTLRLRAGTQPHERMIVAALRGTAVLLLGICLLRPALLVKAAEPQRNVLAVLVDDSRSMRIADVDGRARADYVRRAFGGPDSALLKALGERFVVRTFRFSSDADRVGNLGALAFDGARSRVEDALRRVRQELTGVPLAGIVLVTDGADNADSALAGGAMLAGGPTVPVFAIGVGSERFARDVEVVRLDAPRTALEGGTLAVDVTIAQSGLAGQTAQLVVEDEGRIIASQQITLAGEGGTHPVRVLVPVATAGIRRLTARVVSRPDEQLVENNARELLVRVRDGRERILYIEGEPRFELKFVRRAVADDAQLEVVALQRTADNKFLRLGVRDSAELLTGFPTTREELFSYRAVVLGSIEASYFTAEQLRMLADFVGERGGGLLALGGRRSFREGGYAGTPLAEVMPLELGDAAGALADDDYLVELTVSPTSAGQEHAVTQVADARDASLARWRTLPPLTTVNRARALKPGATALLIGRGEAGEVPVLAYQRYGRGIAAALAVQDSWLWQMHAEVPLEDRTHERFWQQLLRWLVSAVPDRATVATSLERPGAGEPLTLRASVRDSAWRGMNDAVVLAHVTAPSGAVRDVPLSWTGEEDGDFRAVFTPEEDGVHQVRTEVTRGGEQLDAAAAFARTGDGAEEYFEAGLRAGFLRRLAEETGGRYYTPATASALPRDVVYTESGATVLERKELWDMPIVLLLLVGLLGGEWAYRRSRGWV